MRLSKIKLHGFKSFVDATTIPFPSNRVGVVGPNGCGKSNIIDAVRWVMGEISAKNLRGGAMIDVIFNGSGTRQQAATASIELVFAEADLIQFPNQDEIAVKREINRSAQSTYFLNGEKCRRKDITDLFLGTGLGPRSYAIIEQGMISRLIEAKPDELRVFMEEAAGISRYKERRKETEQRMKQTRDNLDRLNDVQVELQKQLEKLQRQAREAERLQKLQHEEKLLKAQLLAIRWLALDNAIQAKQALISEQAESLQSDLLRLNELETTYKAQRETRSQAQAQLQATQEAFYQLEGEINRLQQTLEHNSERHEQWQADLAQLEESREQTREQLDNDQQQLAELQFGMEATEAELEAHREAEAQAEQTAQAAEAQVHDWQAAWDEFNQRAAEPMRRAEVERTQLQNTEQQIDHAQKRLLRLEEQAQQLDVSTLEQELAGIDVEMETIQTALADTEVALAQQQEQVLALRDTTQDLSSRLHSANAEVSQANGRLASLEALQEAALDKGNADLHAWLHVQGLRDAPRLAETLQVAAGWEQAVETVLGTRVQAWCVADLQPIVNGWQQAPRGQLMLLECQTASTALSHHLTSPLQAQGLTPLLAQVQAPSQLVSLLSGVWCVDSVQQAYALRGRLAAHESLLTRDGVWLGPDWLQSQQPNDDAHASVLAREQEISKLATQLQQLDALVARLTTELDQQRQALYHSEEQREQLQRQTNEIRQQHSHLQAQHGGKLARLESHRQQQQRNAEEREELQTQLEEESQAVAETRERLHSALASMDSLADEREGLTRQRDEYQEASRQLRTAWQQAQAQRHQIEVKLQTQRSDSQGLQQAIERLQARFDELNEQHYEVVQMLEQQDDPLLGLREELEDKQQQKVEVEQALADVKLTVEHLEAALSQYEEERHTLESRSSELRANLEQERMGLQGDEVRRQTIDEQLATTRLPLPPEERTAEETEFTPTPMSLLAELPEYADEASWVSQIEAVERKVGKIGSVNMAALQEYEEQRERKQYLDEQAADLEQALQILDNAIKTIDRETRTRFKQTLDTVNGSLQEMFPRLFGGGQATLELVGEDLLKAGVAIMARPPGKRNSTIHLLSGGEKALTAIALVFAIFELNPAPFCMLDEVDAPLDDANVGRFCALVQAMSERVQFIFITHNKITMELADQLIGITQQEAGVSRPVAVDVDEAVEMVGV